MFRVWGRMVRITKRDYFMGIAKSTAKRGTCDRAYVGAILVKEGRVIAAGYNGSPSGMPHCDEVGHEMLGKHCVRTVHAEINCIIQAAKLGISIEGAEIYITHKPCYNCCKALINAGIKKVYYEEEYEDKFNANYHDKLEMVKL